MPALTPGHMGHVCAPPWRSPAAGSVASWGLRQAGGQAAPRRQQEPRRAAPAAGGQRLRLAGELPAPAAGGQAVLWPGG